LLFNSFHALSVKLDGLLTVRPERSAHAHLNSIKVTSQRHIKFSGLSVKHEFINMLRSWLCARANGQKGKLIHFVCWEWHNTRLKLWIKSSNTLRRNGSI